MIQQDNPLLGVNYYLILYNCEFIINFLQGTHKNPFFVGLLHSLVPMEFLTADQ